VSESITICFGQKLKLKWTQKNEWVFTQSVTNITWKLYINKQNIIFKLRNLRFMNLYTFFCKYIQFGINRIHLTMYLKKIKRSHYYSSNITNLRQLNIDFNRLNHQFNKTYFQKLYYKYIGIKNLPIDFIKK